jgi:hypothetical protein
MSKFRTLVETPGFAKDKEELGDAQSIDEALLAVTWALSQKPEDFPVIPGTRGLRMAKTRPYLRGGNIIPALEVWFIIEDDNYVSLFGLTRAGENNDEEET